MKRLAFLTAALVPLVVIASLWVEPILHYRVAAPAPPDAVIEALRSAPDDVVLVELGATKHALIPPFGQAIDDPVAAAEDLLRDRQAVKFDPARLAKLKYAALIVPRTLLLAYAANPDERYFDAAHQFIADWCDYELSAWLPKGLLWNDHAIAARTLTLGEFWRHYRGHASYDAAFARRFLRVVNASAARLADPAHYTHTSNHGTMQNVALMHLGLAFPALQGADARVELGLTRLQEQTAYMTSSEGVVLEHSAGYHRLGMELIGIALRYRTLHGRALPSELAQTYARTLDVYRQLRARDGQLPAIGDTSIERMGPAPLTTRIVAGTAQPLRRDRRWPAVEAAAVYPDAGYAVWRQAADGPDHQASIAWSHFPRHGHKHADELSVNLRSGGARWWRGIGYWPGGGAVAGWAASNAPHRAGEAFGSQRQTRLLAHAAADGLAFIDLERRGPGAFVARRQVVQLAAGAWLVLDAVSDEPGHAARVVWTTDVGLAMRPDESERVFKLRGTADNSTLVVHLLGPPTLQISEVRGQQSPLVGWVEQRFETHAVDALVVDIPATAAWSGNLSLVEAGGEPSWLGVEEDWRDPGHWRFDFTLAGLPVAVERVDALLRLTQGAADPVELPLPAFAGRSPWVRQSADAYAAALAKYGDQFNPLLRYRSKASKLLAGLWLLQLVALVALLMRAPGRFAALPWLATGAWVMLGAWLHTMYLP